MDAEESSDESDSELDEKGTDVYCKTVFFKPALKLHKKKILGQILSKRGFQYANSISFLKKMMYK